MKRHATIGIDRLTAIQFTKENSAWLEYKANWDKATYGPTSDERLPMGECVVCVYITTSV